MIGDNKSDNYSDINNVNDKAENVTVDFDSDNSNKQ